MIIIDDRPFWALSEEEKKAIIEETERVLGPERCKEIDEKNRALKAEMEKQKRDNKARK